MIRTIKREDGFTFIEIIGVMVIMSVLAAVAINRFVDLQGRARDKAVYAAVAELKTRVNSHFCTNLLDGVDPGNITYQADKVDTYLGKNFDVSNWNWEEHETKITFDLTYYPYANDHSLHPLTVVNLELTKPLFGL